MTKNENLKHQKKPATMKEGHWSPDLGSYDELSFAEIAEGTKELAKDIAEGTKKLANDVAKGAMSLIQKLADNLG